MVPVIENPTFKAILIINCALCLLTFGVMVWAVATSGETMSEPKKLLF
jgi:hypothetical protein